MNKTKPKQFKQPKQKQDSKISSRSKKGTNYFKALYKITKERKNQTNGVEMQGKYNQSKMDKEKNLEDSLDNMEIMNEEEQENGKKSIQRINHHVMNKKYSHNRSNSCPLIHPLNASGKIEKQTYTYNKVIIQDEGKKTLKKTSTLHRKNKRVDKKYSIGHSQISQESNTVIVHSLPIQQLSSMLYSLNLEKQKGFKRSGSSSYLSQPIFQINNDLYFQTRLQQQIKMYDLNQQMKKLHLQTENVKIKQEVLQKLANKFSRLEQTPDQEESFLIH